MITKYSSLQDLLIFWNSRVATPLSSDELRKERERYIRKYLIPSTRGLFLNSLDSESIVSVRKKLEAQETLSEATLLILLRILRQVLEYAYEHMLICTSFKKELSCPIPLRSEPTTYSKNEIKAIFNALSYHPLGNYFRLIYFAGLRESEAKALLISDIRNDTLHIRRKITKGGNISLLRKERRRDIRLTPEALSVVEDAISVQEKRKANPSWKRSGDNLLFSDSNGNPISFTRINDVRKMIRITTGIKDFSSAVLRYTAIRAALDSGLSEKAIQDYFGYSKLSYVYSIKDTKERVPQNGDDSLRRAIPLLQEVPDRQERNSKDISQS